MKRTYILITLLMVPLLSVAQTSESDESAYSGNIRHENGQVNITVTIDRSRLNISPQDMIVFTPVLVSKAAADQQRMAPVVLAGGKRLRWIKRQTAYGYAPFESVPEEIIRHSKRVGESFSFTYSMPFREWMTGSELVLLTETSGCLNCQTQREQVWLAALPKPNFRVTYIIPQTEQKTRSENYVCRLNYVVDKYDLRGDFKDNARVLSDVDKVVRRIINNPDFTVTSCRVDGYASPEGRYDRNVFLAEKRAQEFLNYLRRNYNWDTRIVSYAGHGEDWKGLRDTVANMAWLENGDQVLGIIDYTYDISMRKTRLKAFAGGTTYRYLLNSVYPSLRRNEFRISYEIRPYSVDEARRIFRTSPGQLSLNEMFFVAQSYPEGSDEFKDIFDTAVRLYPESVIAKVNAAAMEIEYGAETLAADRLQSVESPEAYNNLGVAYALIGEYALAAECLQKAAAAGDANGAYNLVELRKIYDQ